MNQQKVPEMRFEGFTDDWEQRKLGELSSFEYGLNAAATEFDGKNKYIRITDIDDDSREFNLSDVTSPDTDLSNAENYKLAVGDILFARTGASVGKTYIYKTSDGLVYYAGFLIRAKIKEEYNPEFVFHNTLTTDYEKFIKVTSMRSGQPGINAQEYSQFEVKLPSKPEQDKIATCFRSIDTLIALHQRKCDRLNNLKKAMLIKMFPRDGQNVPEMRFEGFSDDWEQCKLGELSSFEYGLNAAATEFDGKNKYIRITDIDDDSREFNLSDVTSPDTDLSNAENYKLAVGDILFARTGASVGKTYIYKTSDGLVYYAGFLIRAKIKEEYNPEFVFHNTLTTDYEKFIKVTSMRSGQPGINAQEYSQFEVKLPSKPEQDKIATCFRSIDTLIALHQRKINRLKNLKKALLQKMLV